MPSTLILPAAGLATRLGGIPKFLLPDRQGRPLILGHVASAEGIDRILVVTRPDLHAFVTNLLADRTNRPLEVLAATTGTMSETVHHALDEVPAVQDFAVGLPDTAVAPSIPYRGLIEGLEAAEMTVAAYPTRPDQAGRLGAIRAEKSQCLEVKDKDPSTTGWTHHWGAVAFQRTTFEEFSDPSHPHVGFALQGAVESGLRADIAHVGSEYFDLGTIEELSRYFSPM